MSRRTAGPIPFTLTAHPDGRGGTCYAVHTLVGADIGTVVESFLPVDQPSGWVGVLNTDALGVTDWSTTLRNARERGACALYRDVGPVRRPRMIRLFVGYVILSSAAAGNQTGAGHIEIPAPRMPRGLRDVERLRSMVFDALQQRGYRFAYDQIIIVGWARFEG